MRSPKISLATLKEHQIPIPEKAYTLLGNQEDFAALPPHWQEQIVFYNKGGSEFLYDYWHHSQLVTGPLYQPFLDSTFPYTSTFPVGNAQACKKWLYERGLPFEQWVWALPNFNDCACRLTWKMVVKLQETLFVGDDVVLFDESLQWCLFYYHEDQFFWGSYARE